MRLGDRLCTPALEGSPAVRKAAADGGFQVREKVPAPQEAEAVKSREISLLEVGREMTDWP